MSERITINRDMVDNIHFQKDSAGPERFVVTIDVDSMDKAKELQSQLCKESKEYPKLSSIKSRLEHAIKKNQVHDGLENNLDKLAAGEVIFTINVK